MHHPEAEIIILAHKLGISLGHLDHATVTLLHGRDETYHHRHCTQTDDLAVAVTRSAYEAAALTQQRDNGSCACLLLPSQLLIDAPILTDIKGPLRWLAAARSRLTRQQVLRAEADLARFFLWDRRTSNESTMGPTTRGQLRTLRDALVVELDAALQLPGRNLAERLAVLHAVHAHTRSSFARALTTRAFRGVLVGSPLLVLATITELRARGQALDTDTLLAALQGDVGWVTGARLKDVSLDDRPRLRAGLTALTEAVNTVSVGQLAAPLSEPDAHDVRDVVIRLSTVALETSVATFLLSTPASSWFASPCTTLPDNVTLAGVRSSTAVMKLCTQVSDGDPCVFDVETLVEPTTNTWNVLFSLWENGSVSDLCEAAEATRGILSA